MGRGAATGTDCTSLNDVIKRYILDLGSYPIHHINPKVRMRTFDVILILLGLDAGCNLLKVVSSKPHPHTGVVKPFASGDPGVKLDRDALAILKSGKPFKIQVQDGSAGRGMVVQDVQAPVETVWGRILDFDAYPKMVPKTVECATYKTDTLRGGKRRIFVRMKIGFPALQLKFFINHLYDPSQNSLTWTLDYTNYSELDDSAGYWYVIPHPDNPSKWSRVYYSVEVSMFRWVPRFVVDFMSKQALIDATAWVKKYSELEEDRRSAAPDAMCATTPRKSRRWLPFFRRKRNRNDTCALEDTKEATNNVRPISLTRYSLVLTVLSLSLYNIHLYFSQ
jgi:Polyketide cyclase / dehydrase and lipid transport